ncbi:MAG TPA: hypothetical protein DCX53_10380, partial [Anaerolineae bacterium]|nr:hypothetical protein [Anaerolineae bacterium]
MSYQIVPQDNGKPPALHGQEKAKQARAAYSARASSDFYGAVGWLTGLLLTIFVSIPVIWLLYGNASRAARADVLLAGIAVAWWLNPLSLGGLGYVLSNIRSWRWWSILAFIIWGGIN